MGYVVAIVGASGAVGQELLQCLGKSTKLPIDRVRLFGSARSFGSVVESAKFGSLVVELFEVSKARECKFVFLAVSGSFALEFAEAISMGDDGAIVIDNSVRKYMKCR
jgi:aspartate-semialdehyde dehydrogenase